MAGPGVDGSNIGIRFTFAYLIVFGVITLYKTTSNGLKIVGMCIPFVVIGIWAILHEPYGTTSYLMGWLCTVFFGMAFLAGLFQILDKRPQVIINEHFIGGKAINQGEIKWEQLMEAYPLEISGRKFISLKTDSSFVFRKKPYPWATKLNRMMGAQSLNLHVEPLDIDEGELTDLINRLIKANVQERRKLIRSFELHRTYPSSPNIQKVFLYVVIAITLCIATLSSPITFWIMMFLTGAAAVTARWRPDNSTIRKYAGIATWIGFINLVLCFWVIKAEEEVTEKIREELMAEIEAFRNRNGSYPAEITTITERMDLNFLERYTVKRMEYRITKDGYELDSDGLFEKYTR